MYMAQLSDASSRPLLLPQAARRVVHHVHDWLELPLALVPVPFWCLFPTTDLEQCR